MAIAWCLPDDGYGDGDCDGDGDGDDNVMLAAYSCPMIYARSVILCICTHHRYYSFLFNFVVEI